MSAMVIIMPIDPIVKHSHQKTNAFIAFSSCRSFLKEFDKNLVEIG